MWTAFSIAVCSTSWMSSEAARVELAWSNSDSSTGGMREMASSALVDALGDMARSPGSDDQRSPDVGRRPSVPARAARRVQGARR